MFVQLKSDFLGQKAGARVDVADDHGQTLITSGVAEAVHGDPLGPLVAKTMETMLDNLTRSLDQAITTALKQFADAQGQSRRQAVPLIFGEGNSGDPKKNFGDWAYAVARGDRQYLEKHYGSQFVAWQAKAALGDASGVTGGYTVPPDFYDKLLQIAAEDALIRPAAFVQPMASATLQFPYLDITTAQSAGTSPFFGGVIMNWTAEAQTRTETEPQFKQMELKAQELSGYSVSSNILLQDAAFGLEKFLYQLFGKAIGWYEDYAFIQGNGVGKPLGILKAGATIATGGTSGARDNANQVSYNDVATVFSKLLPASWNKAFWTFSPTVIPQLLQLKDGASRAIFISIDQGAVKKPIWKLLGLPAYATEKNPALGTKGDLMLIDPSFYVIGDRMSLEIAASEHVNFLKNQMTWRVVERVDGRPWLDSAITLQDATSTVSPFVVLN
jgi:HK97 family phage major capsid protein